MARRRNFFSISSQREPIFHKSQNTSHSRDENEAQAALDNQRMIPATANSHEPIKPCAAMPHRFAMVDLYWIYPGESYAVTNSAGVDCSIFIPTTARSDFDLRAQAQRTPPRRTQGVTHNRNVCDKTLGGWGGGVNLCTINNSKQHVLLLVVLTEFMIKSAFPFNAIDL